MKKIKQRFAQFAGALAVLVLCMGFAMMLSVGLLGVQHAFATGDVPNTTKWAQTVGLVYKASPGALTDGDFDALRGTSAGLLRVSVDANTVGTTDQEVVGNVAHDAVDSGAPVKIGGIGRAIWESAASTAADRVNASFDLYGRLRTDTGPFAADSWTLSNVAAANTAATVSKAAGTSSQRHVCTGFFYTFSSLGAPTPEQIVLQIRDGATGAGTVKWSGTLSLPAVAGTMTSGGMSGLWIVGTAATAMTIETVQGGGANDYLSVNLSGVTIPN